MIPVLLKMLSSHSTKIDELNELLQIKRNNLKSLFLLSITLIYLFIGATTFEKLESAKEAESKQFLEDRIQEFQLKHNMSSDKIDEFYNHLVFRNRFIDKSSNQETKWNFWQSFFFCFVCKCIELLTFIQ